MKSLRVILLVPVLFFIHTAKAKQSPMIVVEKGVAEQICQGFDSMLGSLFSPWSKCREEVLGLALQADLVDWLMRTREAGANAEDIRLMYLQSNKAHYDSDAFDYLTSLPRFVSYYNVPDLLKAMRNAKYDLEALKTFLNKRPNVPLVPADLMKIMANGTYDSEAISFVLDNELIVSVMLGTLLNTMKDGKYDFDLLKLCNSTSMLNPISGARTLNQSAIINCIRIVKNKEATLAVKAKIAPCRIKTDIVDRNLCLEAALKK